MSDSDESPGRPRYWFPAKVDGMGWGFPTAWQGRVVFGAYIGLMVGLAQVIKWPAGFLAVALVLTAGFLGVCRWKGERRPPRGSRRVQ